MASVPDDIAAMRREITAITGRATVSTDRRYLQNRLASLKRGVGIPSPRDPANRTAPVSISMSLQRRNLVEKMASRASLSTSALLKRAIDEYAVKHGYGADVQRIIRAEAGVL